MKKVTLINGDGIGPEISDAVVRIIEAAGAKLEWELQTAGAEVIEKHFTLDKSMEGPDHKASLEPYELKAMVDAIRNIEKAFGNGKKEPQEVENKNIEIVRKSIVAKCNIKKGETLSEENLTVKRPASGISPMKWDEIIGTIAKKDYTEGELL